MSDLVGQAENRFSHNTYHMYLQEAAFPVGVGVDKVENNIKGTLKYKQTKASHQTTDLQLGLDNPR